MLMNIGGWRLNNLNKIIMSNSGVVRERAKEKLPSLVLFFPCLLLLVAILYSQPKKANLFRYGTLYMQFYLFTQDCLRVYLFLMKSLTINFAKSCPINLNALISRRLLAYNDDFSVDTSISVWVFSRFLWY
jgi:hypothetical protein